MLIEFTKMHGLGNDFVVIDAISQLINLSDEQIRHIANRRFGVGCDQLLLVESSTQDGVDFRYRIFNADGGEVEQCGNGARCFARFVRDKGLTQKSQITVETNSGVIELYVDEQDMVRVNMGLPQFSPADIPFVAEQEAASYSLSVAGKDVELGAVSVGNPHAVIVVDDIITAPVENMGVLIEAHERFPQRVNVGFMQVVNSAHIRLRVFERGVGETMACGTGACAAVVVGVLQGHLDNKVLVDLPGGQLQIQWDGEGSPVLMTGPTAHVFEGLIEI